MNKLSPVELLEIVRTYYPTIRPRDFESPDVYRTFETATPHFRLFMGRRQQGEDGRPRWSALIRELAPRLPGYKLSNQTAPSHTSYEAVVYPVDDPEPVHGAIDKSLVIRVSYLAPVFEIYETHKRMVFVGPKKDMLQFRDKRRFHDIGERFQPAAEVFARAIIDQYGYQRLYPDVLDLKILYMLNWDMGGYISTMAEALFADYRY